MDRQAELAIVRRTYAKQILAAARISDPRIETAFAEVAREDFLGPGPWQLFRVPSDAYIASPDADPIYVYIDQVIGLIPERGINNGQPSLHAKLIAAAQIKPGEHVVHVGAGTGYYTAIMAHLVGPTGKVTAIEFDTTLAVRARKCLSGSLNVRVLEGDGSTVRFDAADVIYVNAGVTHPAGAWLDGLSDGGRLILPLTTDENFRSVSSTSFDPMIAMRSGVFFRIQRREARFEAHGLLPTAIIPAEGARDQASEAALAAALNKGGWNTVTRLVRDEAVPEERCWLRGDGWCLARD
ncbi:MAG: rRNA adenine N-6-methyltransferase family protein [Steroidobacteraceae bacterium]|jgi:protein-L-isoaspartate(D-aspartate) O-methyltransferase